MRNLEMMISDLSAELKMQGYKKTRLNWHKKRDGLTVVFSIQKSQYSRDTWYYYFGICIHDIATGNLNSLRNCHLTFCVDNTALSSLQISTLLSRWESMYGTLSDLRLRAVQGKIDGQCTRQAMQYLTQINYRQ